MRKEKVSSRMFEKLKDSDTYVALAWSLPIGLHHFYLNNWKRAFADIGAVFGLILIIFFRDVYYWYCYHSDRVSFRT